MPFLNKCMNYINKIKFVACERLCSRKTDEMSIKSQNSVVLGLHQIRTMIALCCLQETKAFEENVPVVQEKKIAIKLH